MTVGRAEGKTLRRARGGRLEAPGNQVAVQKDRSGPRHLLNRRQLAICNFRLELASKRIGSVSRKKEDSFTMFVNSDEILFSREFVSNIGIN